MRPILRPGLRPLWRDRTTVQWGLSPRRGFRVCGVDPDMVATLTRLTGADTWTQVVQGSRYPQEMDRLLKVLRSHGALDDVDATGPSPDPLLAFPAHRIGPNTGADQPGGPGDDRAGGVAVPDGELAALSLLTPTSGAARHAATRRAAARVTVLGAGQIVALALTLLHCSGIGQVHIEDAGPLRRVDLGPGGGALADLGRPRDGAALRTLTRLGRERPEALAAPDLVLVTPVRPIAPAAQCLALRTAGTPHLVALTQETRGVVGPLVLPGRTGCVQCADLHRQDRDPAWPRLAAQLDTRIRHGAEPNASALTALVASIAVIQALALIDGLTPPVVCNGTLEFDLADTRLRHRRWEPHPDCPCGSPRTSVPQPE